MRKLLKGFFKYICEALRMHAKSPSDILFCLRFINYFKMIAIIIEKIFEIKFKNVLVVKVIN